MAFQVYRVPGRRRARLERALRDDILSRQSLQVRDARHFGLQGDWIYLLVDGSDVGILRADALLLDFAERAPDAAELRARLFAEDEEAAASLGAIFDAE